MTEQMNPYGPSKDFPILLKRTGTDESMEDASEEENRIHLKDLECRDLNIPIGFIATLYNQMFKEVCNRPTGQRHYTPLSVAALPPFLPASYIPNTARMNDKIKELDANIARLKELVKDDRRRPGSASSKVASFASRETGTYGVRSADLQSGERKRRRTGSDEEEGSVALIRNQFRRRTESSSSDDEKDPPSQLGRSRSRSTSPLSKRRHFTIGGSPNGMLAPSVHPEVAAGPRNASGLASGFSGATSTLGLGAHPGLGSLAIESGDVFDNYRRQRSTRYHKAIAAAFQAKLGPGGDDKLCYICHQPGHFAKHCKFGIS